MLMEMIRRLKSGEEELKLGKQQSTQKFLYGLKQSPRQCLRFDSFVVSNGFKDNIGKTNILCGI